MTGTEKALLVGLESEKELGWPLDMSLVHCSGSGELSSKVPESNQKMYRTGLSIKGRVRTKGQTKKKTKRDKSKTRRCSGTRMYIDFTRLLGLGVMNLYIFTF